MPTSKRVFLRLLRADRSVMAGKMFALFPVIVLYFLFSDRIIQGMMAGATKG
jgi:ABC-type glycerol-3-phosphate transport system permease component